MTVKLEHLKVYAALALMLAILANFAFVMVAPPETLVPNWYKLVTFFSWVPAIWAMRTINRRGE